MSRRYRAILLFGPPGSGKGTQGKILGSVPGFVHCACGDVFRSIDPVTELAREIRACSTRGELVPDELTVRLWHRCIQAMEASGRFQADRDLLVLDGIPRTLRQATLLAEHVDVAGVVRLVCRDRNQLVERIRRRARRENRFDDANDQVISRRLDVHYGEEESLLSYYVDKAIFEIDATQPPLAVLGDIVACVESVPLGTS